MAHWPGKSFKSPSQNILFTGSEVTQIREKIPITPLCLPPTSCKHNLQRLICLLCAIHYKRLRGSIDSVYNLQILISNEACSFSGKNYLLYNKPESPEAFIWDASIPLRSPNPLKYVQYFWLTNGSLEKWDCMQDIIQRNALGVVGQSIHRNICWLEKYFFDLILCQTTQTSEDRCFWFIGPNFEDRAAMAFVILSLLLIEKWLAGT